MGSTQEKVCQRHKIAAKPKYLGFECKNAWGLAMYCCKIKILLWLSGQTSGNKTCQAENSSAGSPKGASTSTNSHLPSFWIPSLTPEAKPSLLKKPVSNLNIKNLIPRAVGVVIHPYIFCYLPLFNCNFIYDYTVYVLQIILYHY